MDIKESSPVYQKTKKTYTYQDYLELPDDRNRYEILEGELIMGPSPVTDHQQISIKLSTLLYTFVENKKLGFVFTAPYDIIIGDTNVIQPDIIFVSNLNKKIITEKNIQGTPDLIIEILSPSTAYYDLIEKKEIYEKFGVLEYWIMDPKRKWIEIYLLEKEKFKLFQRMEKTGIIRPKLLEGLEIDLSEIFKQEET